jgi:hypothetical protein
MFALFRICGGLFEIFWCFYLIFVGCIYIFFNRIKFIEKIHYKSSQSKDYRLVLVRLAEAFLRPALAFTYIV